ncbi:hypothetical protein CRG98_012660 [Punica granatum]|uniref:Uncharacterized protein n=1 Tax=Punica granatum TaxID=22663 RepID=A0A2I0KEG3_PUNGR|nr:hypothetical protein CRG98_012660 [Punica granatum]
MVTAILRSHIDRFYESGHPIVKFHKDVPDAGNEFLYGEWKVWHPTTRFVWRLLAEQVDSELSWKSSFGKAGGGMEGENVTHNSTQEKYEMLTDPSGAELWKKVIGKNKKDAPMGSSTSPLVRIATKKVPLGLHQLHTP